VLYFSVIVRLDVARTAIVAGCLLTLHQSAGHSNCSPGRAELYQRWPRPTGAPGRSLVGANRAVEPPILAESAFGDRRLS